MQKSIQETKLHDHTYLIFRNKIEFVHCLVPFITNGIKQNERCLIVTDEITREDLLRSFKFLFRNGVNPFDELNKGAIVIEKFINVYQDNNSFNIEHNLQHYKSAIEKAILDGYNGLRVFAEVSSKINPESFIKWEKEADKHFDKNKFLAVCAYNQKYFGNGFMSKIKAAHPIEIDIIRTRL